MGLSLLTHRPVTTEFGLKDRFGAMMALIAEVVGEGGSLHLRHQSYHSVAQLSHWNGC